MYEEKYNIQDKPCNEPVRETEIFNELGVMNDLTIVLNKKMDMLIKRLSPITVDLPGTLQDEKKIGRSTMIGGELQKQNSALQSLLKKIEDTLNGIEI